MRMAGTWCALWIGLLTAAAGAAQPADADLLQPVSRFVDDSTVLVARLDLHAINLNAIQTWSMRLMQQGGAPPKEIADALAQMPQAFAQAQAWLDAFEKAGGREVFIVGYTGVPDGASIMVVPLRQDADAKTIIARVRELGMFDVADTGPLDPAAPVLTRPTTAPATQPAEDHTAYPVRFADALVFADRDDLAKVRRLKPVARPEFGKAVAAVGHPTFCAAVVISPALIKQLEGRNVIWPFPLARDKLVKIRWFGVGVQPPPGQFVHLELQAADSESARDLRNEVQKELGAMAFNPGVAQVLKLLIPQQKADRLITALDARQCDQLVVGWYRAMRGEAPAAPATQPAGK